MDVVQAFTLALASAGFVLGVLNTWKTYDKERVKIRVRPLFAFPSGSAATLYPNAGFSIEVINRSGFPVIIHEVGFFYRGTRRRGAVLNPIIIDGKGPLPRKLEAREAASFYMQRPTALDGKALSRAYATTADGRTFTGTSAALKSLNAGG